MKQTITAVIPALNEEKNIERCIKSVLWCDKIIVMWMGSDKTEEIAKKLGAHVYTRRVLENDSTTLRVNKTDIDDFRQVQENINWAIDHCKTDWMLRIDADEVVTDELKHEIQNVIRRNYQLPITNFQTNFKYPISNIVAFGIPRSQFFCGDFLKGGDWAYDRLVRLFKPKYCRYEPIVAVHEQFKINGQVGYLQNKLLHFSHPTLKDAVNKFQKYTDVEIQDLHISKISAFFKMFFNPIYVFFRWMIWHHGYRDGLRGVLAGTMRGWYEFLLYNKYLTKS